MTAMLALNLDVEITNKVCYILLVNGDGTHKKKQIHKGNIYNKGDDTHRKKH